MKKSVLIFLTFLFLTGFDSCKKDTSLDLGPNVNSSNDIILSISSFTNIFNLLIKARLDSFLSMYGFSFIDGVDVTYDSLQMKYSFNFGAGISSDSVRRNGKIEVIVSGDILQSGTYARVSFLNYFEDGGEINGTDSITNDGVDAFNKQEFSEFVTNGSINKFLSGNTLHVNIKNTYRTDRTSLVSGNDILFLIKGDLWGLSSKGHNFTGSIRDTILDAFNCPWIKGGIVDVHVPDASITDGYIDFVCSDGCSDDFWYYFGDCSFKVRKTQKYLKN